MMTMLGSRFGAAAKQTKGDTAATDKINANARHPRRGFILAVSEIRLEPRAKKYGALHTIRIIDAKRMECIRLALLLIRNFNPKGIVSASPRLRGTSYPGSVPSGQSTLKGLKHRH